MIFLTEAQYRTKEVIKSEVYANCKENARVDAARDARRQAYGRKIVSVVARPK